MISFKVTRAERFKITQIAKRASKLAKDAGFDYPILDAIMDITVTHANGNPLRLGDLAIADDGNFAHDVFGIYRYLNRTTGKLTDCFVPRFSQPTTTDVTTVGLRTRKVSA